jgi:hypothetical protein
MSKEKVHTESDRTYNPMNQPTAPRPKPKPKPKNKKIKKRGGGTFNMEIKIPKEMVTQGVMYGYKKGGQV